MIDDSWDDGSSRTRKKIITAFIIVFVVILGVLSAFMLTPESEEEKENQFEVLMTTYASPSRIDATMKYFSEKPHPAGKERNKHLADVTYQRFEEAGLDPQLLEYEVLLTYPLDRHLSIGAWSAKLTEPGLEVDAPSKEPDAAATWNGYSGNGTAFLPLVYVNYGRPEDYKLLSSKGVNLNNKIHLVRYGKTFRGNKVKNAEQHGAGGVIIYSDPDDDGPAQGKTYPAGPWRPLSGVQRGSVWVGNGDPTTPSWPSVEGCPRLDDAELYDQATTNGWALPQIPVQPISASDAKELFRELSRNPLPGAPSMSSLKWQTAMPDADATKVFVAGTTSANLTVYLDYSLKKIYNVIGTITGSTEPDRFVIMGSHRDAWTMGAGDPISSHTALLEAASMLGELRLDGWEPRRSILLASWDAEEPGLIGSTEFVEQFRAKLHQEAIVYINSDIGVTGSDKLGIRGNPQLSDLIIELANESVVLDPQTNGTLLDKLDGYPGTDEGKWFLKPVGSGSDFAPFIQMLGVPVLDIGFESNSGSYSGVYHSNYDSYHWYKSFGDPDWTYHTTLAQFWCLLTMRVARQKILPFNYDRYEQMLTHTVENYKPRLAALDVSTVPLEQAIQRFGRASRKVIEEEEPLVEDTDPLKVREFNNRLAMVERHFLTNNPMPERGWYRHLFFAPNVVDSYAAEPFPLLNDAVAANNSHMADRQVRLLAMAIDSGVNFLRADGFRRSNTVEDSVVE